MDRTVKQGACDEVSFSCKLSHKGKKAKWYIRNQVSPAARISYLLDDVPNQLFCCFYQDRIRLTVVHTILICFALFVHIKDTQRSRTALEHGIVSKRPIRTKQL